MTPETFNKELARIGGYHVLTGKPNLRVVSGLTATKFACGKERVKYVHSSKIEEKWLWGLKDTETGVVTAKSEEDVRANDDPKKFGVRKLLKRTVTFVGVPNYVVEYFRPADKMKDTPLNWSLNRFGWWRNPETRLHEWTDINGEFPFDGRYDHLLTVKEDDGTVWGKFRELGEDILDVVRKAIQAHEAFKKVNTDEELIQQMVDAQEAREEKLELEIADNVEQEIGAAWRRMLKDNPRMFLSNPDPAKLNKSTKHGKAI